MKPTACRYFLRSALCAALHNAAPDLIRAAREAERLREALEDMRSDGCQETWCGGKTCLRPDLSVRVDVVACAPCLARRALEGGPK